MTPRAFRGFVVSYAVLAAVAVAASGTTIESSDLKITLRPDLDGALGIADKRTGRNYALPSAVGLYRILVGREPRSARALTSRDATSRRLERLSDGLTLRFAHEKLAVECRLSASPDRPGIRWGIRLENSTRQPLCAVEFPLVACPLALGDSPDDDAILYPSLEGVLLWRPSRHFGRGARVARRYPGQVCAQLLYYFDPAGGLYLAAHDTAGYPKEPVVGREGGALVLTWRHCFPSQAERVVETAYDVVMRAGGATWHDGADIYRAWAERNAPWCEKKLLERDVPRWLLRANVFLNYNATDPNFVPAEKADARFRAYRKFLGVPIVACAFGWEKHGSWIGPDYFPPKCGEAHYRELCRRLAGRGDHFQVFTSGFRWGVRKPIGATWERTKPRRYTPWDGRPDFQARGQPAAAIAPSGKPVFIQFPWADNYILCVGSRLARDILADCFARLYGMGIAGVDLDQNLGAEAPDCFSATHGHPPGAGHWRYRAMRGFLQRVRSAARATHPECFVGVEEPCEAYIPWLDVVHARAFTDTRWPATGPGAFSVPLYIYLYHDYQLNYAGFIDRGFSPLGDVRMGLGRAFIFGMQLGVRIGYPPFALDEAKPTQELVALRGAARLMDRCRDYLLLGRMLHPPRIIGSPEIDATGGNLRGRRPWPVPAPAVQATAWRSPGGNVCYAVANLSAKRLNVGLRAEPHAMKAAAFALRRLDPDGEKTLAARTSLPTTIRLELQPWDICCVEQRAARANRRKGADDDTDEDET